MCKINILSLSLFVLISLLNIQETIFVLIDYKSLDYTIENIASTKFKITTELSKKVYEKIVQMEDEKNVESTFRQEIKPYYIFLHYPNPDSILSFNEKSLKLVNYISFLEYEQLLIKNELNDSNIVFVIHDKIFNKYKYYTVYLTL